MDSGEKIWADLLYWSGLPPYGRGFIHARGMMSFERGYCFITIPDKTIFSTSSRKMSSEGDIKAINALRVYPHITPRDIETLGGKPRLNPEDTCRVF